MKLSVLIAILLLTECTVNRYYGCKCEYKQGFSYTPGYSIFRVDDRIDYGINAPELKYRLFSETPNEMLRIDTAGYIGLAGDPKKRKWDTFKLTIIGKDTIFKKIN